MRSVQTPILQQIIVKKQIMKLKEYKSLSDKDNDKILDAYYSQKGTCKCKRIVEKFYDREIIDKVEDFDVWYDKIKNKSNTGHYFFRGVSEAKYKLYSSGQREYITKELNKLFPYCDFINKLIRTTQANRLMRKKLPLKNVTETDPYYLSFLQHYGAPTPLIDFSESLDVALFFAIQGVNQYASDNDIDSYFSVYFLSKDEDFSLDSITNKNKEKREQSAEEFSKRTGNYVDKSHTARLDLAVDWLSVLEPQKLLFLPTPASSQIKNYSPPGYNIEQLLVWSNPRIIAQKGCFFLNAYETLPLEDVLIDRNYREGLSCLDIHKSLSHVICRKINYSGLENALFPNLGCRSKIYEKLVKDISSKVLALI